MEGGCKSSQPTPSQLMFQQLEQQHPAVLPAVSSAPPSAPEKSECLASCTASTRASMLSCTSRRVTTTGLHTRGEVRWGV